METIVKRSKSSSLQTNESKMRDRLYQEYGCFSLAGLTLQPQMKYFDLDYQGYVAFKKHGETAFVLGDPVVGKSKLRIIIEKFLQVEPKACFVQCSNATVVVLRQNGFFITPFGVETVIELPYSLQGKRRADIRLLLNSSMRAGLQVKEINLIQLQGQNSFELLSGLKADKARFKNNFKFLAYDYNYEFPSDSRLFGGYCNGELCGMSLFNPVYENNAIIGYAEVIPKRKINSPKGTRASVLLGALRQFELESIKHVNLGLSPFYKAEKLALQDEHCNCYETAKLFNVIYKFGNKFFNYRGLAFHKSRFKGQEKTVYFASRSKLPLIELAKIYRLTTGSWLPPL